MERRPDRRADAAARTRSSDWKHCAPHRRRSCRPSLPTEEERADSQIKLHEKRAARYRWVAPYAHRWLPTTPFDTLVLVCMFVLVATLLKSIFKVWNSILVSRIGNQVSLRYARRFLSPDAAARHGPFHRARPRRFDESLHVAIWARVGQGVQRVFGQALLEPLKVVVCLAIAAYVSWQLLLLTIIIAPLAGYTIHWLGKALKRTHKQAMQELSTIFETLSETLERHEADQGLHDGSRANSRRVPRIVEEALPPADEDRHLQFAGQPAHRNAGPGDGDDRQPAGRLPGARPEHACVRHQDQRHRR